MISILMELIFYNKEQEKILNEKNNKLNNYNFWKATSSEWMNEHKERKAALKGRN